MKTPNEIKNGLRHCRKTSICSSKCKYYMETECNIMLLDDAKAYIEQLEEQIDLMLIQMHGDCGVCKHRETLGAPCVACVTSKGNRPNWEWEGLPEVKTR